MRITTHTNEQANEKGFSLVEIAIVILIVGIAMAAIAQLYAQRIAFLQVEDTRANIEDDVTTALGNFLEVNGRYPCPSSLTAQAGNPAYGRETDCSDGSVLTLAANGLVTTGGIRIGAVPFKELNLDENDTVDGYRNRLIYAVTEPLAVQATFNAGNGVITVNDDQGNPIGNNLHFVVYSTGQNGLGGFTREGAQASPCPAAGIEQENCDFNDTIFVSAQTGTTANALQNDDLLSFTTNTDSPKWETTNDPTEISTKPPGGTGIGPGVAKIPVEEVDVAGVVRAQDDPNTPTKEGQLQSSQLCKYGSATGTECFPSKLIGGDDPAMECPAGQHMIGIQFGQAVCTRAAIVIQCPAGQIMTGINPDGTPKCNAPPPAPCPTAQVNICGQQKTLLTGPLGTRRQVSGGLAAAPRVDYYRCQNVNSVPQWRPDGTNYAPCTCQGGILGSYTGNNCANYRNAPCGPAYTGTYNVNITQDCSNGGAITWVNTAATDCTCINSTKITTGTCPAGFNTGSITYANTNNCATQQCSGNQVTSDTCQCVPERQTRNVNCPSGFSGQYQEEQVFSCPGGPSQPGSWGPWTEVPGSTQADICRCQPRVYTRPASCPPGETGYIEEEITLSCPNPLQPPVQTNSRIITTVPCAPVPPVTCTWQNQNTSGPRGIVPVGKRDGSSCDCTTEAGTTALCSKSLGNGNYQYGSCLCSP